MGEEIDYVEIEKKDVGVGEKIRFILAKSRLKNVFGDDNYEIVREMKGKDLVGLEYEPPYSFVKEVYKGEGMDKAYHVYPANFVTTEDGTGIVHTAAMYGQEDFEFGTKFGLPKYHLVNESGHFTDEAGFLAGKFVKDEETNVSIIKDLAERNLFFAKEKYEHSYPFCWRCQTPLIYYARDSWYIAMSKLRDKLVNENKKINWEPDYIKEGRFGEWL
ncbi:MAG: class I tRNA ligase family protein, partial [Patescibacteria group bacterium]